MNYEVSWYNDTGDYTIRHEMRYDPNDKVLNKQIDDEPIKFYVYSQGKYDVTDNDVIVEMPTSSDSCMTTEEFLSELEKRIN